MEFNSTKIQSLLNRNGVLHYNRKYIPDEYIENHSSDSTGAYAELVLPEDIANGVYVLASGTLPYVTGQSIDIDGGFHIQRL